VIYKNIQSDITVALIKSWSHIM